MTRILCVDDETAVLEALRRQFSRLGESVRISESPFEALEIVRSEPVDLVVSDHRMPGLSGVELLRQIRRESPHIALVILSGYADFDEVTQGFNEGVIDRFINKPWHQGDLQGLLDSFGHASAIDCENGDFHGFKTQSQSMFSVCKKIQKAARANLPVFIYGETGTGKELTAKALHRESSRLSAPFIPFNCANFTDSLMESQLFGHVKGAFTGAVNDSHGLLHEVEKGTLFLDEVTTLPLTLQAKLLRTLQEREFTPVGSQMVIPFAGEIVSASSLSLADAVKQGGFREDLRYRLEVIPLTLPPLRDRAGDSFYLFLRFLVTCSPDVSWSFGEGVEQFVSNYHWPGNVRQLFNVVQYISAMAETHCIELSDFPPDIVGCCDEGTDSSLYDTSDLTVESITEALNLSHNNKSQAARQLKVSRMTLWRKMKSLNMMH